MPRLVKKFAHGPVQVGDKNICMCGLSKNQPFCDGSHKKTLDEKEDQLYWYNEKGEREDVTESPDEEGCCGGGCCCECDSEEEQTETKSTK